MMGKVTNLAAWRAAHPAHDAVHWHKTFEDIACSNLRIFSALQRAMWRAFWRL
jgi:hypothetical protein